jgi:parvulin-like peptidyl-prolyl isomerase
VTRLFYTTLYGATLAAACAVWTRYESAPSFSDLFGAHAANAQSPGPGMPWAGDPAANTMINPSLQQSNAINQIGQPSSPPRFERTTSTPDGWANGVKSDLPKPVNDGLPGVSISSMKDRQRVAALQGNQPGAPSIVPTSAVGPGAAPLGQGEIEGARILARVGTEFILAADVIGPVNEILARNADKIPPSRLEEVREQLIRQRLDNLIQTKMIVAEVRAKIPEEGFKKFSEKLGQQFDEEEVPKVMGKEKVNSPADLDARLRQTGSSLDREKRAYIERQLSMGWIHQQIKSDEEVTMDQMLEFYRAHAKEFDNEATARWEQIVVRFDRGHSKADAYRLLAEAGNRVLRGEKFEDVAMQVSEGPTAKTGGEHDWTTKGSLVSESIDRALFALPIGQLSPILEDERSFQIIRVLERLEAGRTPFTEAQADIKKRIKMERAQGEMEKFISDVKKKVKVWTIYDETPADDLVPLRINAPSITNANVNPAAPPQQPQQQPPTLAAPTTPPVGYPRGTPPGAAGAPPIAARYPAGGGPPPTSSPYPTTSTPTASPYPSTSTPAVPPYPMTGAGGSTNPPGQNRLR